MKKKKENEKNYFISFCSSIVKRLWGLRKWRAYWSTEKANMEPNRSLWDGIYSSRKLHYGTSDQDVPFANVSQSKTVSVGAFYMDETEITNNEYRQFTDWVRDSLAHVILGEAGIEGHLIEEDEYGNFLEPAIIDWNTKIRWDDEEVREILAEEMYLPQVERLDGQIEFDTRKYIYKYKVLDVQSASAKANREKGASGEKDRSEFFIEYQVPVYPDTLTWTHDYSYSFNDPYTKNYFWHPAFDDYPVVGVNWNQANAFSHWRTKMMNSFLKKIKQPTLPDFRLPTESEWEYASRGGLEESPYPWEALIQEI